jgi:transposase
MPRKKPEAPAEPPKPRGRPSEYTEAIAEAICDKIANGIPLREICRDDNMPAWRTVYDWQAAHADFSARIAHARELGEEAIAQECMHIADTPQIGIRTTVKPSGTETAEADMIEHRRLQIDTRLKLLAKWNPRKWGDKLAVGGAPDLPPVQSTLNVASLPTEVLTAIMKAQDAVKPS